MNDFTKEELIILKDALYGVLLDISEEKILANTLQSMIDKYCEHEEEILEGARMKIHTGKCIKCGIKL